MFVFGSLTARAVRGSLHNRTENQALRTGRVRLLNIHNTRVTLPHLTEMYHIARQTAINVNGCTVQLSLARQRYSSVASVEETIAGPAYRAKLALGLQRYAPVPHQFHRHEGGTGLGAFLQSSIMNQAEDSEAALCSRIAEDPPHARPEPSLIWNDGGASLRSPR